MSVLRIIVLATLLSFTGSVLAVPKGVKQYASPAPASDFQLEDLAGVKHRLADYRGSVIVLSFWASWCVPCREEMPSLQEMWEMLRNEGVQVLAVAIGDTREDVERVLARQPVSFPILLDPDSSVSSEWAVLGVPTAFVIDPDGGMAIRVVGAYDWMDTEILVHIRSLGASSRQR